MTIMYMETPYYGKVHDRIYNWYHASYGLIAIIANLSFDINEENAGITIDGQETGTLIENGMNGNTTEEEILEWIENEVKDYEEFNEEKYGETDGIPVKDKDHDTLTGSTGEEYHIESIFATETISNSSIIQGFIKIIEEKKLGEDNPYIDRVLKYLSNPPDGSGEMIKMEMDKEDLEFFLNIARQIWQLKKLKSAIQSLPAKVEFTTYVPYIKRVTNHWFRNLVFEREGTEDLRRI